MICKDLTSKVIRFRDDSAINGGQKALVINSNISQRFLPFKYRLILNRLRNINNNECSRSKQVYTSLSEIDICTRQNMHLLKLIKNKKGECWYLSNTITLDIREGHCIH